MELNNSKVWVIMSKDRKLIAKGSPRNRYLIPVEELFNDRKKFLTYSSKGVAEAAFKNHGFYGGYPYGTDLTEVLEAVECHLKLETL